MLSGAESGIRIENGKVVFGMEPCQCCNGLGVVPSSRECPTCLGTGLGRRGGKGGCKTCFGSRTVSDAENPKTCSGCKGSGKTRAQECSYLPLEIWRSMDFFVYRTRRNISLFQFQMNIKNPPCCYTSHHPSHQSKSDTELIAEVSSRKDGTMQVRWICKPDGTLARHIGIFLCPEGYAVVPVFADEDFIGKGFFIPSFGAAQQ